MLTLEQINNYLIPASEVPEGKRVKGMWAIWKWEYYHPKDGHKTLYCHSAVAKRQRQTLIMENHTRKQAYEVWLLDGRYPLDRFWPTYDDDPDFPKALTRDELIDILSRTISVSTRR